MKCEKCGNEYPSNYFFAVPNICKECFSKMEPEEQAKYFNNPIGNYNYEYYYRVGFGLRFGAALLDIMFTAGILIFLIFITGVYQDYANVLKAFATDPNLINGFIRTILPLSFIVTFMYYAFEIIFAATPGKMILGLKIVDENMQEASSNKLILRYLLKHLATILSLFAFLITSEFLDTASSIVTLIIWGGFLFTLSHKRQGFHDMLAGTIVLRKHDIIYRDNVLTN